MKKIEIIDVEYNGYERLYRFKLIDSDILMYAHGIGHEEYIDSGSKHFDTRMIVNAKFLIQLVLTINSVNNEEENVAIQTIEKSSHIRCVSVIEKVMTPDSFLCSIDKLGEVTVELEKQNNELCKGMKVDFSGNLEIEFM